MPWRRNPSLTVLSGLSEIANVTGVAGPATVANWRSRLQGFPTSKASGKFDLVEVVEWMRDNGPRRTDVRDIPASKVWRHFAAAYQSSSTAPPPVSRATVVALVLLRHVATNMDVRTDGGLDWHGLVEAALSPHHADAPLWVPFADYLRVFASDLEVAEPSLRGLLVEQLTVRGDDALHLMDLVDLLDRMEPLETPDILDDVLRLDPERSLSTRSSGRRLAALAVGMSGLRAGQTLLDPAAGEGTVLTRAWNQLGPSVKLVGQENDPAVWSTLRSRLLIAGVRADLGPRAADSLRDDLHPTVRADAVVIDPPLGEGAPALDRWIEYGLSHLAPNGRMVMVLPMHEFVPVRTVRRRPQDRMQNMLRRLLADELVEGILVVPSRLRGDIVGPSLMMSLRPGTTRPIPIICSRPDARSLWSGGRLSQMAESIRTLGLEETGRSVEGLDLLRAPAGRVVEVLEEIASVRSRSERLDAQSEAALLVETSEEPPIRGYSVASAPEMDLIELALRPARGSAVRRSAAASSPFEELTIRLKDLSREAGRQREELAELRDQHTILRAAALELLQQIERRRHDIDPAVYRKLLPAIERVQAELG